jgi:hypothetical protein
MGFDSLPLVKGGKVIHLLEVHAGEGRVDVGQKVFDGRVFRSEEAVEFFLRSIEKDDGGESLDLEFLGMGLILFRQIFVTAGEVELDEDEFFGGFLDEGLLGEHLLAHHDAGWAPVGAGKLDEDGLIFGFGFLEGLVEIGHPAFPASEGGKGAEKQGGDGSGEVFHCKLGVTGGGFIPEINFLGKIGRGDKR